MNVKFRLVKFENSLLFQIHEQNAFRTIRREYCFGVILQNKYDEKFFIGTNNEVELRLSYSNLGRTPVDYCIYLKGSNDNTNKSSRIYIVKFDSNDDRDKWFDRILNSFEIGLSKINEWIPNPGNL